MFEWLHFHEVTLVHIFVYKSTLYKNTEAQITQKLKAI